ncbi:MAG TPA: DNA primase [Candidatus Paceibacterota bacterium]
MLSPVEQIKSKLSIVDVVGSYIKLEKAGVNLRARCPFHNEKSPSFFVSPGRETFHCFGCGKGGDVFTFVEEIEHVEFREALSLLADKAKVELTGNSGTSSTTSRMRSIMADAVLYYESILERSPKVMEYLKGRGLTRETIKDFRLGFALVEWSGLTEYLRKKGYKDVELTQVGLAIKGDRGPYDRFRGRIMFPFFDYSGRPIGFSGRVLPGVGDERMGKYINSPETPLFHKSKVFYGLDKAKQAIREEDRTILVEGQLDLLMAHQVGTRNAVAVSGTAFTVEHVSIIRRLSENLLIVLDSDEAGFHASEKSLRIALSGGMYVTVVGLPKGSDPADLIKEDLVKWKDLLARAKSYVDYAIEFIQANYVSGKEARDAVATYLYPHVKDMYNEIEKDRAIQSISTLLNVSSDAARKDFDKWQLGSQLHSGPEKAEITVSNPTLLLVARRLLGIAEILSNSGKIVEAQSIKNKVREHLAVDSIDANDAAFEAEMYYSGDGKLDLEVKELVKRLEQESLRRLFTIAMDGLRKAEIDGDLKKVEEYLKKCQELSKQLI